MTKPITLSSLPDAVREQAQRQISRQLGVGNGPTVQPGAGQAGREMRAGEKPASRPAVETWYRVGVKGKQIFKVQVVEKGKNWLRAIQEPNGAIIDTRTDGEAEQYHPTLEQARDAVRVRLMQDITDAENMLAAFMAEQYPKE